MTPKEAARLAGSGRTVPEAARERALEAGKLVRVLGKYPLLTDGHRTYFLAEGAFPREISSLDG